METPPYECIDHPPMCVTQHGTSSRTFKRRLSGPAAVFKIPLVPLAIQPGFILITARYTDGFMKDNPPVMFIGL